MAQLSDLYFQQLVYKSQEHARQACIAVIVAWMFRFGGVDFSTLFSKILSYSKSLYPLLDKQDIMEIVKSTGKFNFNNLVFSCNYMFQYLDRSVSQKFIEMLISFSIEDGYLTFSEHEYLLFLADVFAISEEELEKSFESIVGIKIPQLPDPSNPRWWEQRKKANDTQNNKDKYHGDKSHNLDQKEGRITRLHDLGLLGLDEGATNEEIRKAFMRLVQVHHPDKFQALGEEAVREAEKSFIRIKAAYERLSKNA